MHILGRALMLALAFGAMAQAAAQDQNATLQLLVAVLEPGGQLAPDPKCSRKDVICLDPPPFWLKANVIATLYGQNGPAYREIHGSSHYGMRQFSGRPRPSLLLARTEGARTVMLRNRVAELTADKAGTLFLIGRRSGYPGWLPCTIEQMQEELAEADFDDEDVTILPDDFESAGVDASPEHFRRTARGAMPRYGIRLARLAEYIAQRSNAGLPPTCSS